MKRALRGNCKICNKKKVAHSMKWLNMGLLGSFFLCGESDCTNKLKKLLKMAQIELENF